MWFDDIVRGCKGKRKRKVRISTELKTLFAPSISYNTSSNSDERGDRVLFALTMRIGFDIHPEQSN